MEPSLTVLALGATGALLAGISKGGFGGGVGFVATPLLALAVSPGQAAAIMLPILILIDQAGMVSYWRRWDWKVIRPALIAAAAGIGLGALLFDAVDPDLVRLALGSIAILFLFFQIARLRGWTPAQAAGGRNIRAAVWGATAGLTSTISHAGGPPITIYLLGEKLQKTVYQASTVLVFWSINLAKVVPYAALGLFDASTLTVSAMAAPAALVGVAIGVWAHKRMPDRWFFSAIAALLFITGCKLVYDGATGLAG